MNNTRLIDQAFHIAKLSILLGMVCYGSKSERYKGKKILQGELAAVQTFIDDQLLITTSELLRLPFSYITSNTKATSSIKLTEIELNNVSSYLMTIECSGFRHSFRCIDEVLSELYLFGQAAFQPNPYVRKLCHYAANYYIDYAGISPQIFLIARDKLGLSREDLNRWFVHKGWFKQSSGSVITSKGKKRNE